ncbi:SUMF1/EgtB/PvdO family nonheme iron enzyme [bacterium]|nr:SUMF1/EgtB/PvdO family nonheme iron enzyme [candidate division CSSED10-310 bacterium]
MNHLIPCLSVSILICAAVHSVSADTIFVPDDYATIQGAVDAASSGDTILVADDTYSGAGNRNIEFDGKQLVVASENGPEGCILDCENSSRAFSLHNMEPQGTRIEGFTIINGYANNSEGGGIHLAAYTQVEVVNCIIHGCEATYGGGIFSDNGSQPRIRNCLIYENEASSKAGGIYTGNNATALIELSTIADNTCGSGGGLYCESGSVTVKNCIIYANSSNQVSGSPTITYSAVQGITESNGNINDNPLFITAGERMYLLSSIDAGQASDSPCLDAGDDDAEDIYITLHTGTLAMDEMTVTGDNTGDADNVAMGYHYVRLPVPMTFVEINPLQFIMGSPASESCRLSDETQHTVVVTRPFFMQVTEVTQNHWESVFAANPSTFPGGDHPVEYITWYDAIVFCNEISDAEGLETCYYSDAAMTTPFTGTPPITSGTVYWDKTKDGYRLPTETEWELACRACTATAYNNGDDILDCYEDDTLDPLGWYRYNSGDSTQDAGTLAPNGNGLYDMHGNVWEWCWDIYGSYPSGVTMDPLGAASGSNRVIRGGSYSGYAKICRSAQRSYETPGNRAPNRGMRLVRWVPIPECP